MEMKLSNSGEAPGAGASFKERPPSRLQKQAPASLLLEPALPAAWGGGSTPIPLLSPLVVTPESAREPDQAAGRSGGEGGSADRHGGSNGERLVNDGAKAPAPAPGGVWRHPALPSPVVEPASLVLFFQSQCALELRNAPQ